MDAEHFGILLSGAQLEGATVAVEPLEGVGFEGEPGVFREVEVPEGELDLIRLRHVLSRSLPCLPDANPLGLSPALVVNKDPPRPFPRSHLHAHGHSPRFVHPRGPC
jgi:hypothetical protein